MVNIRKKDETIKIKKNVLLTSALLFLEKGYTSTTIKDISIKSHINASTVLYVFKSKEEILCQIAEYVLEGHFKATKNFLSGITNDKILYYAAETVLQLYMAESDESVRNLYSTVYSLPKSLDFVQRNITEKLSIIFKEQLPDYTYNDFYELEIATSGIIRSFMMIPCHDELTMERKVKRYLETTLLLFRVSDEKIQEAIEFVSQFDYITLAKNIIEHLIQYLQDKEEE